jgi:hypothetical protein
MSNRVNSDDSFAFTVAEEKGDEVIIEVSEEDYLREKADGVEEEFLLKPGRHKFIRGGFLKRHPDFKPGEPPETTVTVTLPIALDVFKYFERRAAELKADSFKTLMADALRQAMKPPNGSQPSADYSALLHDERFIAAVAERVRVISSTQKPPTRKRKRPAKSKARAKVA